MKESLKFFINLYGSPKVLYLDLLLFYHIGFDELYIYIYIYIKEHIYTYTYIYIITLTMQFTSYKYIFQLPKHTKSLPLP